MTKVSWDAPGDRRYETGVDRGVLYPNVGAGVSWSGLISVTESPTGGDAKPFYSDGIKYLNRSGAEEFAGTIEAYTYPDEFGLCDGSADIADGMFVTQQYRQSFGLCYRTKVGNDILGQDYGYKLHLVYNAMVSPSEKGNQTLQETPEPIAFSWPFTTTPVLVPGMKPSAHLIIDSTKTDPYILSLIEAQLYGSPDNNPTLPDPQELLDLFVLPDIDFVVTVNGDGTFTVTGPPDMVIDNGDGSFQLNSITVIVHGDGSYTVSTV